MTPEEKSLLLQDLCGRLPYRPKCHFKYGTAEDDIVLKCIDGDIARFNYGYFGNFHVIIDPKYIKPYLRPMSSMTEEEKIEYCYLQDKFLASSLYPVTDGYAIFDWLNAHHFDYRGLIQMGLALEAPEDMYNKMEE